MRTPLGLFRVYPGRSRQFAPQARTSKPSKETVAATSLRGVPLNGSIRYWPGSHRLFAGYAKVYGPGKPASSMPVVKARMERAAASFAALVPTWDLECVASNPAPGGVVLMRDGLVHSSSVSQSAASPWPRPCRDTVESSRQAGPPVQKQGPVGGLDGLGGLGGHRSGSGLQQAGSGRFVEAAITCWFGNVAGKLRSKSICAAY